MADNSQKIHGQLVSLELSVGNKNDLVSEEIIDNDELEEIEIAEDERLHLKKVSSLVEEVYQKVEKYTRDRSRHTPLYISSAAVSERSSCISTHQHAASLPESLDGGKTEIQDLIGLPTNFETALRINQALQRRFSATLMRLEKTLQDNLKRQAKLKEESEEQGLIITYDKESQENRERYVVKPTSFSIPYFKDRHGTPAPMNSEAKFKVDHGYLDLYTTKARTWYIAEQNVLKKEIQLEWKNKLINEWHEKLQDSQRKLKNSDDLSKNEIEEIKKEIESCKEQRVFFERVDSQKLDMPKRGTQLDWNKIAAKGFDGFRSPEECQLYWDNFLHPSVNRDPWEEDEDIFIQNSVLEASHPNWDEIAKELNTGRTSFQVMQRFTSFIKPTIHPAKWTPEESKKLEDTVNMLRVGSYIPWHQVSQHLVGFTTLQIQSRWRNINPDQSRGPFSKEEDFLLIKGLYKFGLNFDVIAHFLAGRSKVQVRDRFKRSLFRGLTSKPWTVREDKKIMNNSSLAIQHWRKLAKLLPQRDACEIKIRFYTLLIWQSVCKQKTLPPPLFPLSETKDAKEIRELREKLLKLNLETNLYLDKISNKKEHKHLINLLDEHRAILDKQRQPKTINNLLKEKGDHPKRKRIIVKRKYTKRTPAITGKWPDMALTEFFLPQRDTGITFTDMSRDDQLRDNFLRISRALQLNLKPVESYDNLEEDFAPLNLVNDDFDLINESATEEKTTCPEITPLIPPNESTVGAFRSLLLHKPKLKEMASKDFLLFQVPKNQLHKLGDKLNTMKTPPKKDKMEILEENIKTIFQSDEEDDDDNISNTTPATRKRKAAQKAKLVNLVYLRKDLVEKEKEGDTKEAIVLPSEEELHEMFTASELPHLVTPSDEPSKPTIEEEDNLLFHRFVSLFLWPALFTKQKPSMENYKILEELAEKVKSQPEETADYLDDPFDEKGTAKHHLDIENQEKLIEHMETMMKVHPQLRKLVLEEKRNEEGVGSFIDLNKKRLMKKDLVKLKRSLVMKRIWEGRRKGLLPGRNQKREHVKKLGPPQSIRQNKRRMSKRLNQEDILNDDHMEEDNE